MNLYKLAFIILLLKSFGVSCSDSQMEFDNTQPMEDMFLDETLAQAARSGDLKPIVEFIEIQKGNINLKYESLDHTLLMIAAQYGQKGIVEYLIKRGANLDIQDLHESATALHIAVQEGYFEIVKLLVEAGCNYNLRSATGTALDIAGEKYCEISRRANRQSELDKKIIDYESMHEYLNFLNQHGKPFDKYMIDFEQKQLGVIHNIVGLPRELMAIVCQYSKFRDLKEYNKFTSPL